MGRTQNSRKREKFPLEICGGFFILRILNSAGSGGVRPQIILFTRRAQKRAIFQFNFTEELLSSSVVERECMHCTRSYTSTWSVWSALERLVYERKAATRLIEKCKSGGNLFWSFKSAFFSDFFTLSDILTPSCTFHTSTSNIHNHPLSLSRFYYHIVKSGEKGNNGRK